MYRRTVISATLVLLFSLVPIAPSRAATTTTNCVFEYEAFVSPGLTTSPSSGTASSRGETGTIRCDGPVNGKQPTGPGTYGADGRYGAKDPDSCTSEGDWQGVASMTIPTSGGAEKIQVQDVTASFPAFKDRAVIAGTFRSDRWSGTFDAERVEGDCVSQPMTRVRVRGKGTLKDA